MGGQPRPHRSAPPCRCQTRPHPNHHEDDGPGLTDEQIARAARRGERFDQSTAGNGLGIPIAADLAETYDGSLELGRSALGGLQITLRLPC